MGAFVKTNDVDRITFEDGEWVDIKRYINCGEIESLSAEDTKAMQEGKAMVPLLKLGIVAWSFKMNDSDLEPTEICVNNIRTLKIQVAVRLLKEIQDRVPFT